MDNKPNTFAVLVLIYFLTGLVVAALAWLLSAGQADPQCLLKAVAVNYFIALGLIVSYAYTKNFGASLVWTIISLLILGLFKSPWLFVMMIGIFSGLAWLSRTVLNKNFGSLRGRDWTYLTALALMIAALAFNDDHAQYIDFFINKRILLGRVHIDSLYHASVASMIREQGVASTGLHGAPPLAYHVLSHRLFAGISSLTRMSMLEVYGNVYAIAIIPLLLIAVAACAEDMEPSKYSEEFFARLGFVWVLLVGFFGFLPGGIFDRYGLWDSYLISESYTLGLILLLGMISATQIKAIHLRWLILSVLYVGAAQAKVTVGFVGLLILSVQFFFFEEGPIALRSILIASLGLILAVMAFPAFSSGPHAGSVSIGFLAFPRQSGHLFGTWYDLIFWLGLLKLTFIHFFYSWIFLVLAATSGWFSMGERVGHLQGTAFSLAALLGGIFAALFFFGQGGGTYYFSNVSMFVALPFIICLVGRNLSSTSNAPPSRIRWWTVRAVVAAGLCGTAVFGGAYLMRGLNRLAQWIPPPREQGTPADYIRQLLTIRNDVGTRGYLVYIAKEELGFWNAYPACNTTPFLIPAVSERPALFGLPDPSRCRSVLYGLQNYSVRDYKIGSAGRLNPEYLMEEARKLGFVGYIDVTSKRWIKHPTSIPL